MAAQVLDWGSPSGAIVGVDATKLVGFHGATPVAQRAGATQVAASATAVTTTSPWGFSTSTQGQAVVTLVNELRAALVEKGLIKGAA